MIFYLLQLIVYTEYLPLHTISTNLVKNVNKQNMHIPKYNLHKTEMCIHFGWALSYSREICNLGAFLDSQLLFIEYGVPLVLFPRLGTFQVVTHALSDLMAWIWKWILHEPVFEDHLEASACLECSSMSIPQYAYVIILLSKLHWWPICFWMQFKLPIKPYMAQDLVVSHCICLANPICQGWYTLGSFN